jgi:hypothetical protein
MNPALRSQITVSVQPRDRDRDVLDSCLVAIHLIDDIRFVTAIFGPAQIHPQQHRGPISSIHAARAGVQCDQRIATIVRTGEHQIKLAAIEFMLNRFDFGGEFRRH